MLACLLIPVSALLNFLLVAPWGISTLIIPPFLVCTLFFFRTQHYTLGRVYTLIIMHICLFMGNSLDGLESNAYLISLYFYALSPMLFNLRDRTLALFVFGLPIVSGALQFLSNFQLLLIDPRPSYEASNLIWVNTALFLIATFLTFYYFDRIFEGHHSQLLNSLDNEKENYSFHENDPNDINYQIFMNRFLIS